VPYLMCFWVGAATCGPALGPVIAGFSVTAEKYTPFGSCLLIVFKLALVLVGNALDLGPDLGTHVSLLTRDFGL